MDTGTGRDSLSIISQGNISSFADARPEERRLLFEEAAGVAKYKSAKRFRWPSSKTSKPIWNVYRIRLILARLR